MPALESRNLSKRYGTIEALRGVSLEVGSGEIYGLLGQNGAGKTTFVKVLLGIARGWQGEARVLGEPAGRVDIRRRIGYLPEDHRFPDYHTGFSLLDFYGTLYGLTRAERRQRIADNLDMVGLTQRMHWKVRTYSKGMKQRLGIAQALLHDPELIFLDEPTDGVDPVGRRDIRQLLVHLKSRGKTIFLNSHLLSEVEQVCDRVGILQQGVMIKEGDIASLTRLRGTYHIGLAPGQTFPREEVERQGYEVRPVANDLWEVELPDGQSIDPVVAWLQQRSLSLRHLVQKRQTLEDLFVQTVTAAEPGVDARAPAPAEPAAHG